SGYVKTRQMTGTTGVTQDNQYSAELFVDCLSPAYHTFPVTNAVRIVSRDIQGVLPEADYVMPSSMFSCSPRTYGTGILKYRSRRFVPLIEALDDKGETAGYLAYMVLSLGVENEISYGSGMWASFNTNDVNFLGSEEAIGAIACVAAYFNVRTMLYGGGAGEYTYFPGDEWTVGAETISEGMMFGDVSGITDVTPLTDCSINVSVAYGGETVFEKSFAPYDFTYERDAELGNYTLYSAGFTPQEAGDYRVTAELRSGGTLIDRLSHEVCVYVAKPESERKYVTAVGKDLYLDGEVWKCFGVNYMPSTGISLVGDDYEKMGVALRLRYRRRFQGPAQDKGYRLQRRLGLRLRRRDRQQHSDNAPSPLRKIRAQGVPLLQGVRQPGHVRGGQRAEDTRHDRGQPPRGERRADRLRRFVGNDARRLRAVLVQRSRHDGVR
ncbi:MAG: hypothetical protein J5592_02110, partial [Clostridia bacterium]|nr:hypothetical protein [Clostridia bacterium]